MKILMATMGLDIGGAETHIVELAKELKAEGHDIVVASNGGVYVPEIVAAGIRHYQVPMHRRDAGCMLRSRKLLKEIIRTERPDVVHAHARIPAFLCGTLQRTMKFPFVTTAHWVFTTKGGLRYLTNWGQRTVAVSDDIKAYLIREYGVPEEHISVTINGIDTEKFSPQTSGQSVVEEFGLDRSRPVVSYVSRMDEDRALVARQLIQIAEELDRAVPGVQLLIAGGGNVFRELKEQAEAVNARLGRTCVVMTGPRTDINQIVAAGDIFVGVSRSALEAMSAAKPVIVAGNEGYQGLFGPEKLEEARLGNFCCRGLPMSTPERLLADMAAVLSLSPEQKAAAGAYGREVIFQYYSVRRMAADCLAMYEQVRRRKYQVVMSGYYGFSNAGDDAILEAIHQSILEASGEVGVTVLSNDPRETQRHYGMNAIPRFRFWKVFGALRRCDALLSGGGSLLQDRTSTRSLLYYLSNRALCRVDGEAGDALRQRHRAGAEAGQPPPGEAGSGAGRSGDPAGPQLRPGTGGDGGGASRSPRHGRPGVQPGSRPQGAGRGTAPVRRAGAGHSLRGGLGAGLAGYGQLRRGAGRPVRPSLPDLRDGDPVPDDAALPGPGGHRPGAERYGVPLPSAGRHLHPEGADGRAGGGQAVFGYAAAHPDFLRPDGGPCAGVGL